MYRFAARTRQDSGLSDEVIKESCPAVFAQAPAAHVSGQYQFIPTAPILKAIRAAGFMPVSVSQHRAHEKDKEQHSKHMIRFRAPTTGKGRLPAIGDVTPEICLTNGHDASTTFHLFAGLYRLICLNGMVVGDATLPGLKIVHKTTDIAIEEIMDGIDGLTKQWPIVLGAVERMQKVKMDLKQQNDYAAQALRLRYGPRILPPITPAQVLTRGREEDKGQDLWSTYNVVQENLTTTVHESHSWSGRKTSVRGITQVAANTRINRELWDLTTELMAA